MSVRDLPFPKKFRQSMAAWMLNRGMILGHLPEDINSDDAIKVIMNIAAPMFPALGGITPIIVSGGKAKAEKVKRVLKPFKDLSDLVGVKITQKLTDEGQYMILLIYGDELRSREINERFDLFTEFAASVADLGIHLFLQSGGLFLFPLVVFFDSAIYAKRAPKILARGWRQKFWKKITLRACTISVAEKKMEWADMKGLTKEAGKAWEKLGVKGAFKKFQPEDLNLVIQLAAKLMKQKFHPS